MRASVLSICESVSDLHLVCKHDNIIGNHFKKSKTLRLTQDTDFSGISVRQYFFIKNRNVVLTTNCFTEPVLPVITALFKQDSFPKKSNDGSSEICFFRC